jgi:hypothetical protein
MAVAATLSGAHGITRIAYVRGLRLTVFIEHRAAGGDDAATAILRDAVGSVYVTANHHLREPAPLQRAIELQAECRRAIEQNDTTTALKALIESHRIAVNVWLHSLAAGDGLPDLDAAEAAATALAAMARIGNEPEFLGQAEEIVLRLRRFVPKLELSPPLAQDWDQRCAKLLAKLAMLLAALLELSEAPRHPLTALTDRAFFMLRRTTTEAKQDIRKAARDAEVALDAFLLAAAKIGQQKLIPASAPHQSHDEISAAQRDTAREAASAAHFVYLDAMSRQDGRRSRELSALILSLTEFFVAGSTDEQDLRAHAVALISHAGALLYSPDDVSVNEADGLLTGTDELLSSLPDDASLRAEYCLDHGWVKYYRQEAAAGEKLCERGRAELTRLPESKRNEGIERMARSLASLHSLFLISGGTVEAALSAARFAVATAAPLSSHLLNLALCEDKAGLKLEALQSLRRALEVSLRDNPLGQDVVRILFVASALAEARDIRVALELHAATEALLDAQRTQFAGADIKVAFDDAAHHREIAQTLVGRLAAVRDYGGALEAADRSRARVLLELFDVQQDSEPEHQDRSTNAEAPPLEAEPLAAFATAASFIRRAAAKVVEAAGAPLPLDRAEIVDTVKRSGRPALVLQPEHGVLHMFIVLPEETVIVATSPVPLDEIRAATQTAQEALGVFALARARSGGKLSLADIEDDQTSTLDAALDRLSTALFTPFDIPSRRQLLEAAFSKRGLTLVPYRDLALLPFALLRMPNGRMLIEEVPLSMVPSIASLRALCMRKRPPPKGCVVYGEPILDPRHRLDPLPGAAAEARLVEKLLRASGLAPPGFEARLGADATEASFRSDALDAALVHLACHAAAREPASQSALYLAPSANHDGLLLPHEIADGQLANALVFLSACQTGLGRPTADGVIGLGRAFLEAGALAVILSLWRVADAAAVDLAGHFYRAALGIDRPAADAATALQIAMLATRASLRAGRIRTAKGEVLDDHPAHWAPFALVGEASLPLRESLQMIRAGNPVQERTP